MKFTFDKKLTPIFKKMFLHLLSQRTEVNEESKKGLQVEGCLGRRAEVGAFDRADDVSVAVDVAHELLQTPEAALAHAQETLGQVVVERLQLRLDVGQDGSDQLDDGDDQ